MLKRSLSFLNIFMIFTLLLAGCSIEEGKAAVVDEDIKEAVVYNAKEAIDQVVINEMETFSVVKVDSEKTLTKQEEIKTIQDAFLSANKEPGVADMADPQFKLKLGRDYFFLWIHESKGTIMKTKDTHVIYSLSEEKAQGVYTLLDRMYGGNNNDE